MSQAETEAFAKEILNALRREAKGAYQINPANMNSFLKEFNQMGERLSQNEIFVNKTSIRLIQVSDDTVELARIVSATKGTGTGSAILKRITTLADKYNIKIDLTVIPDSPNLLNRLTNWYKRFGFAIDETKRPIDMQRIPRYLAYLNTGKVIYRISPKSNLLWLKRK